MIFCNFTATFLLYRLDNEIQLSKIMDGSSLEYTANQIDVARKITRIAIKHGCTYEGWIIHIKNFNQMGKSGK